MLFGVQSRALLTYLGSCIEAIFNVQVVQAGCHIQDASKHPGFELGFGADQVLQALLNHARVVVPAVGVGYVYILYILVYVCENKTRDLHKSSDQLYPRPLPQPCHETTQSHCIGIRDHSGFALFRHTSLTPLKALLIVITIYMVR